LLSSQFVGGPGLQLPPEHVSPLVQALPSLHEFEFGVLLHPLLVEQESFVQALPSFQLIVEPEQVAPLHLSFVVQAFESLHDTEFGALMQTVPLHESFVQGLLSLQSASTVH